MKQFIKQTFIFLFLFVLAACSPAHYSENDLNRLNAKYIAGKITKQSRGSFILQDKSGTEDIFRTGELTQYVPEGYRSQQDDIVSVTFKEDWTNSGQIKRSVLQLKSIEVPVKNQLLSNVLKGDIVNIGRGSSKYAKSIYLKQPEAPDAVVIYVPSTCKFVFNTNHPQWNSKIHEWSKLNGRTAEVTVTRTPILRGNAYILEAEKIVLE